MKYWSIFFNFIVFTIISQHLFLTFVTYANLLATISLWANHAPNVRTACRLDYHNCIKTASLTKQVFAVSRRCISADFASAWSARLLSSSVPDRDSMQRVTWNSMMGTHLLQEPCPSSGVTRGVGFAMTTGQFERQTLSADSSVTDLLYAHWNEITITRNQDVSFFIQMWFLFDFNSINKSSRQILPNSTRNAC